MGGGQSGPRWQQDSNVLIIAADEEQFAILCVFGQHCAGQVPDDLFLFQYGTWSDQIFFAASSNPHM